MKFLASYILKEACQILLLKNFILFVCLQKQKLSILKRQSATKNTTIAPSELILNEDGSIYHLQLLPHQIADTIITVGDPGRVAMVSEHFDKIDFEGQKREFVTHTGWYQDKKICVISTGIGTDNIDIVLNELDALVNIDLDTRKVKPELKSLNIIRVGTSGALQPEIPVDSFVASAFGLGLDNLLHFYQYQCPENCRKIQETLAEKLSSFYIAPASDYLLKHIGKDLQQGITATCSGFYGPQGRSLRLGLADDKMLEKLRNYRHNKLKITNFEMETSAIYGMAQLLGHQALSINAILANRSKGKFSKTPKKTVEKLIKLVLERIVMYL